MAAKAMTMMTARTAPRPRVAAADTVMRAPPRNDSRMHVLLSFRRGHQLPAGLSRPWAPCLTDCKDKCKRQILIVNALDASSSQRKPGRRPDARRWARWTRRKFHAMMPARIHLTMPADDAC